ncbi:ABC transporter permease subunit, partial [bacterium]|nr:ABC transporter permease subunit [bacterium]
TLFIGSSQIALDRRRKTLILYLSKPLGKLDYLFGKGIIVFFYLCVVTVIPALLLMFLHAMFTDDWMYLVNNLDLMMRIITLSMVMVVPLTIVILMLSALSKSTETTAVMFCLVFYIPYNLGNILGPLIRSSESYWVKEGWKLISLRDIADELGKTLFQIESGIHIHWSAFLIALVAICLLAGWICYRRIQAVEVVN